MRVNAIKRRGVWGALVLGSFGVGCNGDDDFPRPDPKETQAWSWVERSDAAALLSVHGTASDDVWFSGADDGTGPLVLHWDGSEWERHETGTRSDLWWVHAVDDGPVFFGGSDATVLRFEDGAFERLTTPGLGKHTVFGIWASAADDVYAVGARAGRNGFIWHYDGERFVDVALPDGLPEDEYRDQPGLLKVWGASPSDVWIVGGNGVVLNGNAEQGFSLVQSGGEETLFTVHCTEDKMAIVGGTSEGTLLATEGGGLVDRTPERAPLLQGVSVAEDGTVWAVGQGGAIYRSRGDEFEAVDPGLDFVAAESLHAVWVDETGGVWAAGGDVLTPELDQGLALHLGAPVQLMDIVKPEPPAPSCPVDKVDPEPDASIARRWDEQLLNAIRRDVPRPTVHARNLFHFSIAVWDAFSAYTPDKRGYLVDEKLSADDIDAARAEAISYAAYRVLSHRYATAVGGPVSQACFDAFMQTLGLDPSDTDDEGDGPRELGNRIGAAIIAEFAEDGANELENYADPEGFEPDNPHLVVDRPGTEVRDPTLWQKLVLAEAETQNGIPAGAGAQPYIGGNWGHVTPFALVRTADDAPYLDIGTPPVELDDELVAAAVANIRRSAELDVEDDTLIDVSPGAMGNNPLGTNDGTGLAQNPVTGDAYAPVMVQRSDFGRVLAEFWADGPTSETPPGHWNTIANDVSDSREFERRLFGAGDELSALEWDAHVYLALNGAVHDAAIAAWELKREYVTARPITLVRHMAGLGQRTDPNAPSYHEDGLPLVDDLIELVTEESSQKGERHEHLARFVGELAVRAWRGEPGDRKNEIGGVGWIRALEWMPYQRRTFVTPAFPGYVSGHSTFSRAAAVVMAGITGSEYFPGGYASYEFQPGYLFFERGPSAPVRLGWATYFDAADQAGQSRVWGGIHVNHDDFDGRRVGASVGDAALAKARTYFTSE